MVRAHVRQPVKKEAPKRKTGPRPRRKNVESGIWPCKINGCNKEFAREADLKRHQRTTKLHSCPGFACPQCESTFTRTDALRRHQKSRHNGVVIGPEETDADSPGNESVDEEAADSPAVSPTCVLGSLNRSETSTPALTPKSTVSPAPPPILPVQIPPPPPLPPPARWPSPESLPGPSNYYREHTNYPLHRAVFEARYPSTIGPPTSDTRHSVWTTPGPADGVRAPTVGNGKVSSYHPSPMHTPYYPPKPSYSSAFGYLLASGALIPKPKPRERPRPKDTKVRDPNRPLYTFEPSARLSSAQNAKPAERPTGLTMASTLCQNDPRDASSHIACISAQDTSDPVVRDHDSQALAKAEEQSIDVFPREPRQLFRRTPLDIQDALMEEAPHLKPGMGSRPMHRSAVSSSVMPVGDHEMDVDTVTQHGRRPVELDIHRNSISTQ